MSDAPDGVDYALSELAAAVNQWCAEARLEPANGQVGEAITERNIRFYRTTGLIDAPTAGGGRGYGERHLLQLTAIRILQAQGLPLRRIRELLFGRSLTELREIRTRGRAEARNAHATSPAFVPGEAWQLVPVTSDLAILHRPGLQLTGDKLQQLRQLLES